MKNFSGLSVVNIELTNKCNKNCWMCGRRKVERDYPELATWNQDNDYFFLRSIARQLPKDIIVQFHSNGEPLVYPFFKKATKLFKNQIRCMDTNGKLLMEKANQIIDNMDTITISVIENDPEGDEQFEIVKNFICKKGARKPLMIYRLLGDVSIYERTTNSLKRDEEKKQRWYTLPGIVTTRILHHPMGSYHYSKKVTIPEHGICMDLLTHMVIDVNGKVHMCVRFDPKGEAIIGDARKQKLLDIWNGEIRRKYIEQHKLGIRKGLPLCERCEFYGVPTGNE